jgi:speckle-type POZ protein
VGVVVSATESPMLHSISVPESDLGLHFGALLENQEASDVTFDVAGEKFHAHKLVLAARSPVFKAKFFDSSEQSNEVVITDMEPTVFKVTIITFLTFTVVKNLAVCMTIIDFGSQKIQTMVN